MNERIKAQVTLTENWKGRLARVGGTLLGGLLVVTQTADSIAGHPVPWSSLPSLLGPSVALGLGMQVLSAWFTTHTPEPPAAAPDPQG